MSDEIKKIEAILQKKSADFLAVKRESVKVTIHNDADVNFLLYLRDSSGQNDILPYGKMATYTFEQPANQFGGMVAYYKEPVESNQIADVNYYIRQDVIANVTQEGFVSTFFEGKRYGYKATLSLKNATGNYGKLSFNNVHSIYRLDFNDEVSEFVDINIVFSKL